MVDVSIPPDFQAAETYLKMARDAHEKGDDGLFIAARKLVMVALGISDAPPSRTVRAA